MEIKTRPRWKGQDDENHELVFCSQKEKWKIKFLGLGRQELKWNTWASFEVMKDIKMIRAWAFLVAQW